MHLTFHQNNFRFLCDELAAGDAELKFILDKYGYPPIWTRPATFQTLIHIILEQQVSLASAKAALLKLKSYIGTITPGKLMELSDEEMRLCYFSRQKAVYAKHLAGAIIKKELSLKKLSALSNDEIRNALKNIKGIGDWTADVFLLFACRRTDLFPIGDLAMIKAFKEIKKDYHPVSINEIIAIAEQWRPYRSIAVMMLWHYYIRTRNIKF